MKLTSFDNLRIGNPTPELFPLTLTRFLMFNTTQNLRDTIELFFSSISVLQPI